MESNTNLKQTSKSLGRKGCFPRKAGKKHLLKEGTAWVSVGLAKTVHLPAKRQQPKRIGHKKHRAAEAARCGWCV